MRTLAAGLLAIAAGLFTASHAQAQVVVVGETYASSPANVRWSFDSYNIAPYSYYAALPFPARDYAGYGRNDFPYYGRPYGSPSDPWTWPYMSTPNYYGSLARYYYPPVR